MTPIKDVQTQTSFDRLEAASLPVNHVELYYNAGHPGVPEPRYHIVPWHVSEVQAERVAK